MNILINSLRQLSSRTLIKNQFGSLQSRLNYLPLADQFNWSGSFGLVNEVQTQNFFTSPDCWRIKADEDHRLMSKRYMDSDAYYKCYENEPVWKHYRRNFIGQKPPAPRRTCIRAGKISTGNPCPICRDKFLIFDYRNIKLLKQFVDPATGKPFSNSKTNICGEQQRNLIDEVLKSQEHGYMLAYVPIKKYDYDLFYQIAESIKKKEQKRHGCSTAEKSTNDTSITSHVEDITAKS